MEQIDIIKSKMLEILKEFDSFCRIHNLQYSMDGGSLIGAVRHKGFIPWDDDIDVVMERSQYMRFLKLSKKYFSKKYKIVSPYNDSKYYLGFAKIIDANTTLVEFNNPDNSILGVYIDIFPVDFIPDDDNEFESIWNNFNKHKVYCNLRNYKSNYYKTILLKYIYKFMSFRRGYLYIADKYLAHNSNKKTSRLCYFWTFSNRKIYFDSSFFQSFIDVPFENLTVRIISQYEKYLDLMYENYRILPPHEQRVSTHSIFYLNLNQRLSLKNLIKKGIL